MKVLSTLFTLLAGFTLAQAQCWIDEKGYQHCNNVPVSSPRVACLDVGLTLALL